MQTNMAIRKQHIEGFAKVVAKALHADPDFELNEPQAQIREHIVSIIKANMDMERRLDEEADKLLQRQLQAAGAAAASIDNHKARQLIKKELAKQKGFVL